MQSHNHRSTYNKQKKARILTHVIIDNKHLKYVSLVLLEQIRIIDKLRLKESIGKLTDNELKNLITQ